MEITKGEKLVRDLRNKSGQMDIVMTFAKNARPNELKALKHLRDWLWDRADEAEELLGEEEDVK